MHERFNKYFWDGGSECCSGTFKLHRIIEYASFPDLIQYPFSEVKQNLAQIDLKKLRTSQSRIDFMHFVLGKITVVSTWDELFFSNVENQH